MLSIFSRLIAVIVATSAVAVAAWETGMQEPASLMAEMQRDLNTFMMVTIVIIGLGVFGVMFYSILKHRKDKGYKAAHFHENTLVEVIWTAVPVLIIIGMALPATSAILYYKDTTAPDITIKATGIQWKWAYEYLNEDVSFHSQLSTPPEEIGGKYYNVSAPAAPQSPNYLLEVDNELVVPVGKKVRLLLTAADVIHAWWVPQLGVKQDAIPGLVRDAWFQADREGVFRGQCAELCGKNHGFMPIVVRAVAEPEYNAWLEERRGVAVAEEGPVYAGAPVQQAATAEEDIGEWTMESAMARGEKVYNTYCTACHQATGAGLPPAFPSLIGSPVIKGPVSGHVDIALNGKTGTAMASFSYLSDADIAAVVTYQRNAWGNDSGDLVSPDDIKLAR